MTGINIVLPDQTEPFTETFMLALAIYREARGEDLAAKIAVGCVIRNRVQHPGWYAAAVRVMNGEPDTTGGATFYFDASRALNPPDWAKQYAHTMDIGAFRMYKPG